MQWYSSVTYSCFKKKNVDCGKFLILNQNSGGSRIFQMEEVANPKGLGTPLVEILVFCWSTQGEISPVSGPKLHNKLNHNIRMSQFTICLTWQFISSWSGLSMHPGVAVVENPTHRNHPIPKFICRYLNVISTLQKGNNIIKFWIGYLILTWNPSVTHTITLFFKLKFNFTGAHGVQEHMVYRSTWFTRAHGVQEHMVYRSTWFTGAHGLQEHMVYRSTWWTGAHRVQEHMVYRSIWFTGAHGVQEHMVYRSTLFAGVRVGLQIFTGILMGSYGESFHLLNRLPSSLPGITLLYAPIFQCTFMCKAERFIHLGMP